MKRMKLSVSGFGRAGKVVRQNDVYTVMDVSELKDLVVSMTILHPGKETSGHSHDQADEVYFFVDGEGSMLIGDKRSGVKNGDIMLIPRGDFHRVFNRSKHDLKFVCVFEKYGDRC